jgi:hypothetical protein
MVYLSNSKRKTGGPPVYQHGLFELSIDPFQNSLDNTFKKEQKARNTWFLEYYYLPTVLHGRLCFWWILRRYVPDISGSKTMSLPLVMKHFR